MYSEADRRAMQRAIDLAWRGAHTTMPNPRVGCVIVRDGEQVGEGWHQRAGEPHAEVLALQQAGDRAWGATVYVTLEPCAHHGRTPPCADRLVQAGVARVIAAMEDPNPLVNGQGLARLRAAGIDVRCGLLADEARMLNEGFVSRMQRGRPWLRLKVASSLDGFIALPDGRSQWITGQAARADGHEWRARASAILTGSGTVLADNPALTVRHVSVERQPVRVLVDARLQVSAHAKVFGPGESWVVHARPPEWPDDGHRQRLADRGVRLVYLPSADGRHVDLPALMTMMAEAGFNEVHVEAGAGLNAALIQAGCVDEILLYMAPALLGQGKLAFGLPAVPDLAQRYRLAWHEITPVGEDVRMRLRVLPALSSTAAGETP
ncbi:MAG: bifunctional diaminohydroxyphosphoribosylaminopyrimidine deaminase/5-amino-6-(5-phosphoribosylamino)uracil reductase RibD [Lautropia sp.]|nr:bifunctional diaminohydroxyphosphoribosylaminopyrimidine deaminase/5-amino-6-(5-phosphoribosylamino)uracil reductase RibD [Lautropia sp.]